MGEDRFITTPDGRKIRAMIHGNGPTLVVLDAGLGANGFYWSKTYKLLAEKLPDVCIVAYDRAGMGASDPDPRPRTLAHMADDLDTIIDSFVPRQVFLIGHSWGGTLAQFAAARRRATGRTITGVMLVDSSTRTNQYSSLKVRTSVALAPPILRLLGRTRLAKLAMFKLGAGLPRPLRNAAIAGRGRRQPHRHRSCRGRSRTLPLGNRLVKQAAPSARRCGCVRYLRDERVENHRKNPPGAHRRPPKNRRRRPLGARHQIRA